MEFEQIWPRGGRVEIEEHLSGLQLGAGASDARPVTVANFISSVDGRASVQGRSGGLGDDGDRAVFRALRRSVDAVLVGTRTLQIERYGRIIADAAARDRRVARGLRREPLAVTLTRSGRLPLEIPLFDEPEAEIVVFSDQPVDLTGVRARVELVRLDDERAGIGAALTHLRREHGVRALLCEGGPRIFGALLAEGLVDQLFLTVALRLAGGGDAPAISSGPPLPEPAQLALEGVLERAGMLFLRYSVTQ